MAYFDILDSYLSDTASNALAEEPVRRHTPPPILTRPRPPPRIPFATRPTFSLPTVPVAVSTPVPSTPSSVNYWYDDDVPRLIGWVPPVQIPFAGAEPVAAPFPGHQEMPAFAAPTNNTDRLTNLMEQMAVMFNNQQAFQYHQMTSKSPAQPKKYIAVPEGFDGQAKNWSKFKQQVCQRATEYSS